jgi:hypothetical protein
VRRTIIAVTALLLAMSIYVANFGFWMRTEVVDVETFTESAIVSFAIDGSYEAIGDIVAERMTDEYPVLALMGSSLGTLLGTILATEPFEPALEAVARDVHAQLFDGAAEPVVIDLSSYQNIILDTLSGLAPGLVELLPDGFFREYTLFESSEIPGLSDDAENLRVATWVSTVGIVMFGLLVLFVARSAIVSTMAIGVALIIAATATLIVLPPARGTMRIAISSDAYTTLAVNLYDTATASLVTRSLILGGSGAVMVILSMLMRLARKPSASKSA